MPISREVDGIDIRNILQAKSSHAVQSEEEAEEAENQPTKPDHNAHYTPNHGHASPDRRFGQPKHITTSPDPSLQAGRKPNAAKPKTARATIEQEPPVSARSTDGTSQSDAYSVTSYGPDWQPAEKWDKQKCLGCIEKMTQNPFRFTKVCCYDWLKLWWWTALILVILLVGIIAGTIIALLPATFTV